MSVPELAFLNDMGNVPALASGRATFVSGRHCDLEYTDRVGNPSVMVLTHGGAERSESNDLWKGFLTVLGSTEGS